MLGRLDLTVLGQLPRVGVNHHALSRCLMGNSGWQTRPRLTRYQQVFSKNAVDCYGNPFTRLHLDTYRTAVRKRIRYMSRYRSKYSRCYLSPIYRGKPRVTVALSALPSPLVTSLLQPYQRVEVRIPPLIITATRTTTVQPICATEHRRPTVV